MLQKQNYKKTNGTGDYRNYRRLQKLHQQAASEELNNPTGKALTKE